MKKCLTPGEQGVREASGSVAVEMTGGSVCTLKIGPAHTHTHRKFSGAVFHPRRFRDFAKREECVLV